MGHPQGTDMRVIVLAGSLLALTPFAAHADYVDRGRSRFDVASRDRGKTPFMAQAWHWYVYRADDKIEYNDRTLEEMKARRGPRVCELFFSCFLEAAREFVGKKGGEGAKCSCP